MYDEPDRSKMWDATDIKMCIKRYFYHWERSNLTEAMQELEFLRMIHREWSYNPLMRRCDPEAMVVVDEFIKWWTKCPVEKQSINDFTIRRILKL